MTEKTKSGFRYKSDVLHNSSDAKQCYSRTTNPTKRIYNEKSAKL